MILFRTFSLLGKFNLHTTVFSQIALRTAMLSAFGKSAEFGPEVTYSVEEPYSATVLILPMSVHSEKVNRCIDKSFVVNS